MLSVVVAGVMTLDVQNPDVAFVSFLAVPMLLMAIVTPPALTLLVASLWLTAALIVERGQAALSSDMWVRLATLGAVTVVAGGVAWWRQALQSREGLLRADLIRARDQAREDEQLLQAVSDSILDPLVFLRPIRNESHEIIDFQYDRVNDAMCAYLSKHRDDVLGTRLLVSTPGVRKTGLLAAYVHTFTTGEPLEMNDVAYFNEILGVTRHYDIRANRASDGLSLTWRDVTDRVEAARVMTALAQTDPLTGLLNRTEALHRMEVAAGHQRRPGQRVAAIFCDIDDFKGINDRYGHHAGDRVLQAVAARIRSSVRDGDIVARFGGDEILVLLDGVHNVADAQSVAETIQKHMTEPIPINGSTTSITLSLGIAVSDTMENVSALIAEADRAMYTQKSTGHQRIIVLSAEETAAVRSGPSE